MKKAIIEEILDPLNVVLEILSDPDDIARLNLALNKVRSDLNSFFGDLFEAEDFYANELGVGSEAEIDDKDYRKGVDSLYYEEWDDAF